MELLARVLSASFEIASNRTCLNCFNSDILFLVQIVLADVKMVQNHLVKFMYFGNFINYLALKLHSSTFMLADTDRGKVIQFNFVHKCNVTLVSHNSEFRMKINIATDSEGSRYNFNKFPAKMTFLIWKYTFAPLV
jgi:hypothetical protein